MRTRNRIKANAAHAIWRKTSKGLAYTRSKIQRKILRNKAIVLAYKSGPCVDCGDKLPPECMDLDHVTKKRWPSSVWSRLSLKSLLEELEKCEVRCPSCHRVRHYLLRLEGNVDNKKKVKE